MSGSTSAVKQNATLFAFLRHYHDEIPSELLNALPECERHDTIGAQFHDEILSTPISQLLGHIHYSWVAVVIESDRPDMRPLWCAALPDSITTGLKRMLDVPTPIPTIPEPIQRFLAETLYERLGLVGVLPRALLPPSGLNSLLEFNKRTLVHLIDLLGIYDIAAILRRSVLPTIQQATLDLLTPNLRIELQRALQSQDILPTPKVRLEEWTTDTKRLKRLLQLRGLTRLGRLLGNSDASLVWHLAHQLDSGRGKVLMTHSQHRLEEEVESRLIDQLDLLLQRLPGRSR